MAISFNEYTSVIVNVTKDYQNAFINMMQMWNGATEHTGLYPKGEMRKTKFRPPKGYTFRQFIANDVNLEELKYKDEPSDKVVLMVHGGSFIHRMSDSFVKMIPFYAEAGHHATVVVVDYRVAPDVTYREMIQDVVNGYKWLLEEGYKNENIILAGDSSGGGTALSTALYLRDNNYPLPAGIITLSACTNAGGATVSVDTKKGVDLIFGKSNAVFNNLSKFLGDEDYKEPYISPYYGEFYDFPPMLMQVGGNERFFDDSKDIAKKAYKAGVDIKFEIYENMFHDFQNCKGELIEADLAWSSIEEFMKKVWKTSETKKRKSIK